MFEAHLEIIFVDDFVLVGIEQVEQFEDFFVHVLVLDDAGFGKKYMDMMAKNSEMTTWSLFSLSLPVYRINWITSSWLTRNCIEAST